MTLLEVLLGEVMHDLIDLPRVLRPKANVDDMNPPPDAAASNLRSTDPTTARMDDTRWGGAHERRLHLPSRRMRCASKG